VPTNSNRDRLHPYDPHRYMGTLCQVGPLSVRVNLPLANHSGGKVHHGNRVACGEVGEFVVVEADEIAVLGRILDVRLPDKERLSVEPGLGDDADVNPIGTIQLLASFSLSDGTVLSGVTRYPRLGSRVYSAHPNLIHWLVQDAKGRKNTANNVSLQIASLPDADGAIIGLTPEQLFGRHCAVLGATGGGKSWTVARLIEECLTFRSKVILLDATGEFHTLPEGPVQHAYFGCRTASECKGDEVSFPYRDLTENDLFAIFRPSGQSQGPKLRAAMKSLKLVTASPGLAKGGLLVKADKAKQPVEDAYRTHVTTVESPSADFEVTLLARQIEQECIHPSADFGRDPSRWGALNGTEYGWCVSLVYRIEDILQAAEMACIFKPGTTKPLKAAIDEFLKNDQKSVLRLSLQHIPFSGFAREILANAIGRHLLGQARSGLFRSRPLLVFLDEAHQFLDKQLGDESSRYSLDAFGLIAKEGRKYGLTVCISTQRPRDIPEDVLSQMGTLIVHRMINDRDREVVERASGDIDRSAAAFLPTLGPGEAVIIGVDIPVPLAVQIERPSAEPESRGPDYQKYWSVPNTPNEDRGTEGALTD
jgi:hypothetical protein